MARAPQGQCRTCVFFALGSLAPLVFRRSGQGPEISGIFEEFWGCNRAREQGTGLNRLLLPKSPRVGLNHTEIGAGAQLPCCRQIRSHLHAAKLARKEVADPPGRPDRQRSLCRRRRALHNVGQMVDGRSDRSSGQRRSRSLYGGVPVWGGRIIEAGSPRLAWPHVQIRSCIRR
jgi:hypothetical protein